ncbi:MAG: hypothetical protein LiPW41_653, partial [Parcubacteria group bacterium LiPW_41]
LQHAAKAIEVHGIEGYPLVVSSFGEEVANTVLVTHLRITMGSMEGFPPNPEIDERVKVLLESKNIYL